MAYLLSNTLGDTLAISIRRKERIRKNVAADFFHRNNRRYGRWFAVTAYLFLLLMPPQYVHAAPGDTLSATVGTTVMYDTNVFRLSPLINPALVLAYLLRADQIITSTFALNLNKVYLMQRFEANGSLVDNRYNNFDFLNFLWKKLYRSLVLVRYSLSSWQIERVSH